MLVLHRFNPADVAALLPGVPGQAGMTPAEWEAYCDERGLLAFAAEEDGELVGLALAESGPQAVHVLAADGRPDACRLLVERLVRLAGERDVTAWCPEDKGDLRETLRGLGFVDLHRGDFLGRPSHYYRLGRNDP
ncbi:MAG: hypothetical protein U0797_26095 [Gemmataceae bacterium]